jgi:leucine dehydrogenase
MWNVLSGDVYAANPGYETSRRRAMGITKLSVEGYEKVLQCHDLLSGLDAIISIHNTTLGPALGGMRMWPYQSAAEALCDANRLAKGMTYKAAVAGVRHGGGKAVIIGQALTDKTVPLLRAMGRFIHTLQGQYITAEDVGTTAADMIIVRQETPYVAGLPRPLGGSGDPAPFTALGVFLGLKTCVEWALQADTLRGLRIAVQGCGNVAIHLCRHLHGAGAELIVTDVVAEKAHLLAQQYGARVVAPEEIYDVPCDIYAPCALGGTLNDDTIPRLRCQIVAGSANNQCLRSEHSDALRQRGIVYAPDFVINAGGLLNIAAERAPEGYNEGRVLAQVRNIAATLRQILATARAQDISTQSAAIALARSKLAQGRQARAVVTSIPPSPAYTSVMDNTTTTPDDLI